MLDCFSISLWQFRVHRLVLFPFLAFTFRVTLPHRTVSNVRTLYLSRDFKGPLAVGNFIQHTTTTRKNKESSANNLKEASTLSPFHVGLSLPFLPSPFCYFTRAPFTFVCVLFRFEILSSFFFSSAPTFVCEFRTHFSLLPKTLARRVPDTLRA